MDNDLSKEEETSRDLRLKLWEFINIIFPYASGNLDKYLDVAIEELKYRDIRKNDKIESALAAIGHLRKVAKEVKDSKVGVHNNDCHCCFCLTEYALSCTSGYAEKK